MDDGPSRPDAARAEIRAAARGQTGPGPGIASSVSLQAYPRRNEQAGKPGTGTANLKEAHKDGRAWEAAQLRWSGAADARIKIWEQHAI
jgi:hypothetical protein